MPEDPQLTTAHAELAAIATYLPPALVRRQLADPAPGRVSGAYWQGSVLFADLSGFTALSENLSALGKESSEELSMIINNLFTALLEEIHAYGGELLKFGGDALTAFFDAADLGETHAVAAAAAALAMQQRMQDFAALHTRAGVFRLRLRIGVHSGRVFAAQVGDIDHIELVITGRTINNVALAQEIAEPGEVVLSKRSLDLIAGARVSPRNTAFFSLHQLPANPAARREAPDWSQALANAAFDADAVHRRLAALRPYLPYGLPRRFLLSTYNGKRAGEFRPVSVLFANFFPFGTALDILGDEAATAAQVLNAYYARAQRIVHRYGGIINKVDMYTRGDKLMALFGAPIAHEDDPERAVLAALDLKTALAEANHEVVPLLRHAARNLFAVDEAFFQQCIGINTGVVFAGQVGAPRRREYTVMGRNVNIAARLMSVAPVNTVILSPATRRAVASRITMRELAPVQLKGLAAPLPIAEALGRQPVATDRQVPGTGLVGRNAELDYVIQASIRALAGQGGVVAITGDAGIGKTRLVKEALQQLVIRSSAPVDPVPVFVFYDATCQSYAQRTPYALFQDLLRQFFQIDTTAAPAEANRRIQRRVADLAPQLSRFAPLLDALIGIELEQTALSRALSPEQRRDRACELVEALLLGESRRQPLILVLDDLQWIDASSLELLLRIASGAAAVPLLFLLNYRSGPGFSQPWLDLPGSTRLELGELSAENSRRLLNALLNDAMPPELDMVLARAQGNPFFIEEVVRSLIDAGVLLREGNVWRLVRAIDKAGLPDSIEGLIIARLDRIDERSRELLQVGSVIGRRFAVPVLRAVGAAEPDLDERLERLAADDLIMRDVQEHGYVFRQAITRDVTYETILYARRRELHRRVAEWLARLHAERLDDQLTLLARHYLLAEDWPAALEYHLRAGRYVQARYANREAIALFSQALEIANRLEMSAPLPEIYQRLGDVYALIGEYEAALTYYQAALDHRIELAPADVMHLHHQVAWVYAHRTEFDTALAWIDQAMMLPAGSDAVLSRCLLLGAGLLRRQGRFEQSLRLAEQARSLAEQAGHLRELAHAYKSLGTLHLNLGNGLQALEFMRRCLPLYEQAGDLSGLADAHNDLANVCFDLGEFAEAGASYEAAANMKHEIGDVYGQGMIACNLGELFRVQGRISEAIACYEESLAIYSRIGSNYMIGLLEMNLGAARLLSGALDHAGRHLERAARLFAQSGGEDYLPELERYRAELALRQGDLVRAQRTCEYSIQLARQNSARAEEGMSRHILGLILAEAGDSRAAWDELQHARAILNESGNRLEAARTMLAIARLAHPLGHVTAGQSALGEAAGILSDFGTPADCDELAGLIRRYENR
jgi:class 3 adenylate cyclase/tetratricopeptide (TPR) repeat protein